MAKKTPDERAREAATPYMGPLAVFSEAELARIRRALRIADDEAARSIVAKIDRRGASAKALREPAP